MSLSTTGDLITEVLVRNNRTTTDGFITDAMLQDWTRQANTYCTTKYKWPLSEIRDQTTSWAGTEEVPYSSFGIKFKADSVRYLIIGGKRVEKTTFEEYQTFREKYPTSINRIFSDYARILFINPNADISGTIAAFGQFAPTLDPTDTTATTIFSTFDEEGNEAIVSKMTSYLKAREHLPDEVLINEQYCDQKLADLWSKVQAEQYKYKPSPTTQGFFKRIDVLQGRNTDELNLRNQF
jgi:hypothetical protein